MPGQLYISQSPLSLLLRASDEMADPCRALIEYHKDHAVLKPLKITTMLDSSGFDILEASEMLQETFEKFIVFDLAHNLWSIVISSFYSIHIMSFLVKLQHMT